MGFKYLKFFSYYFIASIGCLCLLLGGAWVLLGYISLVLFFIIGDAFFGDDLSTPNYAYPQILTGMLWLALPIALLIVLCGVQVVAEEKIYLPVITDYQVASNGVEVVVAVLFCGFMLGGVGTISAHELVHRVGDRISVTIGRWILALSFDANFSIEHVYGHHRYVATAIDPATAPRGRNVYSHIIHSTVKGNISAWNIEKRRLERQGVALISAHNRCLRGYCMSLTWLAAVWMAFGISGFLSAVAAGLIAKALLEIVNYMEHYGMLRDPKQRVMPHHSWNSNRRISSWCMFNLCRHSHHHAHGAVPFHKLNPMPEAPAMVSGYMATVFLTLIPPLWFALMRPKLAQWDRTYSRPTE